LQPRDSTGRPQNPRVLAGYLRRAQPFLRALGIEIVSTVGSISADEPDPASGTSALWVGKFSLPETG
jgi:hypothetical protein